MVVVFTKMVTTVSAQNAQSVRQQSPKCPQPAACYKCGTTGPLLHSPPGCLLGGWERRERDRTRRESYFCSGLCRQNLLSLQNVTPSMSNATEVLGEGKHKVTKTKSVSMSASPITKQVHYIIHWDQTHY